MHTESAKRTDIKNCNQQDHDFWVDQQIKCSIHWSIFIVNVHRRKFYEAYLIAYCTNIIICHKFKYQWNWFMLNPCI